MRQHSICVQCMVHYAAKIMHYIYAIRILLFPRVGPAIHKVSLDQNGKHAKQWAPLVQRSLEDTNLWVTPKRGLTPSPGRETQLQSYKARLMPPWATPMQRR